MTEENITANQSQDTAAQQSDTPGTAEKTFTQAELNRIVTERIAREKANLPTKEELAEYKKWRDENKTADEKNAEEIKAANAARTAAEQRAADFEAKYTAMSKGVKSEAVEDVIALARVKVSDSITLEQAIDEVIKKYPQFGSSAPTITTGAPNSSGAKLTGVEAAFFAKNPGLKI